MFNLCPYRGCKNNYDIIEVDPADIRREILTLADDAEFKKKIKLSNSKRSYSHVILFVHGDCTSRWGYLLPLYTILNNGGYKKRGYGNYFP